MENPNLNNGKKEENVPDESLNEEENVEDVVTSDNFVELLEFHNGIDSLFKEVLEIFRLEDDERKQRISELNTLFPKPQDWVDVYAGIGKIISIFFPVIPYVCDNLVADLIVSIEMEQATLGKFQEAVEQALLAMFIHATAYIHVNLYKPTWASDPVPKIGAIVKKMVSNPSPQSRFDKEVVHKKTTYLSIMDEYVNAFKDVQNSQVAMHIAQDIKYRIGQSTELNNFIKAMASLSPDNKRLLVQMDKETHVFDFLLSSKVDSALLNVTAPISHNVKTTMELTNQKVPSSGAPSLMVSPTMQGETVAYIVVDPVGIAGDKGSVVIPNNNILKAIDEVLPPCVIKNNNVVFRAAKKNRGMNVIFNLRTQVLYADLLKPKDLFLPNSNILTRVNYTLAPLASVITVKRDANTPNMLKVGTTTNGKYISEAMSSMGSLVVVDPIVNLLTFDIDKTYDVTNFLIDSNFNLFLSTLYGRLSNHYKSIEDCTKAYIECFSASDGIMRTSRSSEKIVSFIADVQTTVDSFVQDQAPKQGGYRTFLHSLFPIPSYSLYVIVHVLEFFGYDNIHYKNPNFGLNFLPWGYINETNIQFSGFTSSNLEVPSTYPVKYFDMFFKNKDPKKIVNCDFKVVLKPWTGENKKVKKIAKKKSTILTEDVLGQIAYFDKIIPDFFSDSFIVIVPLTKVLGLIGKCRSHTFQLLFPPPPLLNSVLVLAEKRKDSSLKNNIQVFAGMVYATAAKVRLMKVIIECYFYTQAVFMEFQEHQLFHHSAAILELKKRRLNLALENGLIFDYSTFLRATEEKNKKEEGKLFTMGEEAFSGVLENVNDEAWDKFSEDVAKGLY